MKKPIIFAVDDDEQVLKSIQYDLRQEFRKEYRILSTNSVKEALEVLKDLKAKGENVALFLSDQRMPEMLGVDFLEKAKVLFPDAKRVLLTAYSDTDAAIRAINEVQLDYYLLLVTKKVVLMKLLIITTKKPKTMMALVNMMMNQFQES